MFYEYLTKNNMHQILDVIEYKQPSFSQEKKVFNFLDDIISNNRSVLIYGDYDVDGIMCAKTMQESLEAAGHHNYDMFQYQVRTHSLDKYAIHQCIQGKYDYFLIGDTASSDMDALVQLTNLGIKVVVLDHHNTIYNYEDYPEDVAIINTVLENYLLNDDVYKLSAGALCYCVFEKWLSLHEISAGSLKAYALTSLYADCMDMSNELNRSIYWDAIQLNKYELPLYLQHFMNDYTVFGRRYIDFWFSPRINALFRAEQFALINKYFFSKNIDAVAMGKCIDLIEKIYQDARYMVSKVTDILQSHIEELNNFVLCNLAAVNDNVDIMENKLYNYTGLIANKLTDKYRKTAVVYCETPTKFKGSVRDCYGRNYLALFKQFCHANGHNPAFGFFVNLLDFADFKQMLYNIDSHFAIKAQIQGPVIEEYTALEPDSGLLGDMALYNDFVGGELPTAYIRKQYIGNIRETYSEYYHKYIWSGYTIQSNYAINFGATMLLKPIKRKDVTLMA